MAAGQGSSKLRIKKIRVLGKGGFGQVSLATLDGKTTVAVKSSFPGSSLSSNSVVHEEEILSQLQGSPYVVACLGRAITYDKQHSKIYNLFLEYLPGGSLFDHLTRSGGRLSEPQARDITRTLVGGLVFIHAKGYVHCDIKPENILLPLASAPADVKICDFGLAKKAGETCTSIGGTPRYMSPEAVTCRSFEPPMDVWALGCVVLEMVTGEPPWKEDEEDCSVLERIASDGECPDVPSDLSDSCKDFLKHCFVRDAENRWTADMLLLHPFLQSPIQFQVLLPHILFRSRLPNKISST